MAESKAAALDTVLVLGSGGREHAIAWKLAQSSRVGKVLVAPGNGGTAGGKIVNISGLDVSDHSSIARFCESRGVDFVVVGPEAPLAAGIVDSLAAASVPTFGPRKSAARIEASKAFSKEFMARHGIPTAEFKTFSDYKQARSYLETVNHKVVLKASGLAAGKGVLLPENTSDALEALEEIMVDKAFGTAGSHVVIEERLSGPEVSVLAFTDGTHVILMPAAQDHKRALDGDFGLNTGGMGAYAPAPVLTASLREFAREKVIKKAVDGLRREGSPFVGVLYAGLMLDPQKGPMVLEFNCRFGDPETQAILPLLQSDLYVTMRACVNGDLASTHVEFSNQSAVTVVAASGGYPKKYKKGKNISGVAAAESVPGAFVFHAGTKRENENLLTNGGRVLAVTGVASGMAPALRAAYNGLDCIKFEGKQYRLDIAQRALGEGRQLRVAVLGSTRGTDLQAIIDRAHRPGSANRQHCNVVCVASNRSKAGILERAKRYKIPAQFVSSKGLSRVAYDAKVGEALEQYKPDLILLIGYMRIISAEFIAKWQGRMLNVHPSLLPKFAGGMDINVHEAVLKSGDKETGCTVHFVEEKVDAGKIVVQKACAVRPGDTPETLKMRVQALEGDALIEAIYRFRLGLLTEFSPFRDEGKESSSKK